MVEIFEKPARTIVSENPLSATIVLVVITAFGSVLMLAQNLPVVVNLVAVCAALVGVIMESKSDRQNCKRAAITKSSQKIKLDETFALFLFTSFGGGRA